MWIAKPINLLSDSEISIWQKIEGQLPLSQSLAWAKAIESVSGKTYLVFSPEEKVGGVLFTTKNSNTSNLHFECVNGPHLNWDDSNVLPRQFATFAMAVSKLDRNFGSLSMKPRWEHSTSEERQKHLPIPVSKWTHASTLAIPIQSSIEEQFEKLTYRIRRTLRTSWNDSVKTEVKQLSPESLLAFHNHLKVFGDMRGFTVPPLVWFQALTRFEAQKFWIVSSSTQNSEAITQTLVFTIGQRAYYLFGFQKRIPQLRGAISTSATAQWETLLHCMRLGIQHYDLNGYLIDAEPTHPYYGVCQFKKQFGGTVIKFDIPEFVIQ